GARDPRRPPARARLCRQQHGPAIRRSASVRRASGRRSDVREPARQARLAGDRHRREVVAPAMVPGMADASPGFSVVLAGGGCKTFWGMGVLRSIAGLLPPIDHWAGTSAGAIMA